MQGSIALEKPAHSYVLRDYQEDAVKAGVDFFRRKSGPNEILVLPTGCHAKGAEILMSDNSIKLVEDIVVGDKLKCPTSSSYKEVLQLCRGREKMYRINYSATRWHDVNAGHMLHLSQWPQIGGGERTFSLTVEDYLRGRANWMGGSFLVQAAGHGFGKQYYSFGVTELKEDDFYGFTLDGDHLYMTSDYIIHHNSGKSIIIAGIADELDEPILVLQPSKEILAQNYEKYVSFGNSAGIFSASVGRKDIEKVTFASIMSIMAKDRGGRQKSMQHFLHYKYIIIDEADLGTSAKAGQMKDFLEMLGNSRVLGLTATPFRLFPHNNRDGTRDSMLKFLTRTSPRIFGKLAYHIQISELKDRGYLSDIRYFDVRSQLSHGFNRSAIKVNSTGADYDEDALQKYYDTIDFKEDIVKLIRRINKTGRQVLVFMSSVSDAEWVSSQLPDSATVSAKTSTFERNQTEKAFKSGKLRSCVNCGVFMVGFDSPSLKTVLWARPLRSLAKFYQGSGRAIRPFNNECAWIIDCCGNIGVFGRIEDLRVEFDEKNNLPMITGSGGRILTGVPMKEQEIYLAETMK